MRVRKNPREQLWEFPYGVLMEKACPQPCKPRPETWSAQFRQKLELAKGFEPPTL